jgi:hypothetical protein
VNSFAIKKRREKEKKKEEKERKATRLISLKAAVSGSRSCVCSFYITDEGPPSSSVKIWFGLRKIEEEQKFFYLLFFDYF